MGTVSRIERKAAWIALGAAVPANEPAIRLTLLVSTLRPERAAWLVEKATERGVAGISFLHTERAPRTFGPEPSNAPGGFAAAVLLRWRWVFGGDSRSRESSPDLQALWPSRDAERVH